LTAEPAKAKSVGIITNLHVGDKVFAIEVEDRSMSPDFYPTDRVVFDPEVRAEPGDFVLALAGEEVLLRKYRMKSTGVFELAPMNPDWPTLGSDADSIRVLGTLVEHRRYRKT
jgi:SOS-response transcriptional repressor LexA